MEKASKMSLLLTSDFSETGTGPGLLKVSTSTLNLETSTRRDKEKGEVREPVPGNSVLEPFDYF